jgi:hypothetical protein
MSFDLLYPAIIAFSLLLIGLVLTILEFKKMNSKEDEQISNQKSKKR